MRIQTVRTATSVFGLIGAVALSSAPAFAQAADDEAAASNEIVVTAQRREERLVDVPITVTTLGADQLETANVQSLSDIGKITPSLRFDTNGGFTQPTIRGVGTAVVNSGGGANVGIYIDGFYSPNPAAADSQLMNVQSVQVLKGPQGTLFGRNTTGGAILIQSADPSEKTSAQVKASYGRFNEVRAQGYATTGIAEGVAVDIEGMYRRGDGFVTNINDGNDKVGKFENWSVRAGLKVDFGPASLLIRYTHGDIDDPTPGLANTYRDPAGNLMSSNPNPPAGFFTTDPDEVALDLPTFFRSKSDVLQATFKADIGFADLTSYTQFRQEKVDQSLNIDNTGVVGAFPATFQIAIPVDNETLSQEILLTSKPGGRLQWTAGLFAFANRDTYFTFLDNFGAFRNPLGPTRLGGSSTTTQSYAAFLDATYEITPQLFVTAGARYAHDRITDAYYNAGPPRTYVPPVKGDRVTPRFVVRYKPSEQSSIYASFTRGYKAAIIDIGGTCQNPVNFPTPSNPTGAGFTCNPVEPEKINAYEVGFKYGDRKLSVELSGFYYDYTNLQISQYRDGRAAILNAAAAEIYGVEGAIRFEPFSGFQLTAGGGWTHARYKQFDNAPLYLRLTPTGPISIIPTNLANVTMQRTPEFTGNLGASYKTDLAGGQLALSGNLYYSSKFFFGPSGVQFPQEAYEVVSARAQWTDASDRFSIAVYGDNLTNNRYLVAQQYGTSMGANWSAPTTYGVEVGVKF